MPRSNPQRVGYRIPPEVIRQALQVQTAGEFHSDWMLRDKGKESPSNKMLQRQRSWKHPSPKLGGRSGSENVFAQRKQPVQDDHAQEGAAHHVVRYPTTGKAVEVKRKSSTDDVAQEFRRRLARFGSSKRPVANASAQPSSNAASQAERAPTQAKGSRSPSSAAPNVKKTRTDSASAVPDLMAPTKAANPHPSPGATRTPRSNRSAGAVAPVSRPRSPSRQGSRSGVDMEALFYDGNFSAFDQAGNLVVFTKQKPKTRQAPRSKSRTRTGTGTGQTIRAGGATSSRL